MKKQTRLLLLPTIVMAAMVSMLISSVSVRAMGTDLIWTVVTSENDFGPGTLRQAILDVNVGGPAAPNAIAFAKNVKTIQLQSLLPTITEPVLIDGLAKVSNGTVVQEGDCSTLPSPADDPCAFTCALRVTIDGSTIPLAVSPDDRAGLEIDSSDVTIRGIRIQNITTPGASSTAIGVAFRDDTNNRIECCEIDNIRNTAGDSFNFSAGIFTASNSFLPITVNKVYIHNIQGGLINVDCNSIGSNTVELISGSAFGIVGRANITDSRIEQVESGSIIACCQPGAFGSEEIGLIVGSAVGITNTTGEFELNLFIQDITKRTRACPTQQASCPECVACPGSGSEVELTVEHSVITTIIGGSIVSNIATTFVGQGITSGIIFDSFFNPIGNFLISENSISAIHSGEVTLSGDNSSCFRFGAMGIFIFDEDTTHCIRCNTITDITLGTLRAGGSNTIATTGSAYGIAGNMGEPTVECNTVSHIHGGLAIAEGNCSLLFIFGFFGAFGERTQEKLVKNVPSGNECIFTPQAPVSGINIFSAESSVLIANNTVHSIFGGKRVTKGSGSAIETQGSMGITLSSNSSSILSALVDTNSVHSVFGPTLVAQAGGSLIQNSAGSAGIRVNSYFSEVKNNCVEHIAEGKVQVNQNSTVSYFTSFETFPFLQKTESVHHTHKNKAIQNPNATFVPIVTAGISVSAPTAFIPGSHQEEGFFMLVQNNTVTSITGATVPGGQLPLGSIGVGLFTQPSLAQILEENQLSLPTHTTKASIQLEICKELQASNLILGDVNTNIIQSIVGGTNAPAYGILLDGSQLFLAISNFGTALPFFDGNPVSSALFSITNNTIKSVSGNGSINSFSLTNEQLSAIQNCCFDFRGTGPECDLERDYIPFLPFEPTSGIYTLFGGCSQISSNTITKITDSKAEARGITTAASSDMDIFDNILSQIKGYGIFVGGSVVDESLATGTEFILEEVLPSLRNKIYNNSTFDNTNKGIELGLINWNDFVFSRNVLDICKTIPFKLHQEKLEDSFVTYGNHGQVAPCIKKVTCNSNGTITIDVTLTGTLPLTAFIIQFFRNSSNSVPHGEQHISMFDNPQFVLHTDSNGNAHGRFTFLPVVSIQKGDSLSAHVTVKDDVLSPAGNEFFGDTSEFSTDTQTSCLLSDLTQKPSTPSRPDFCNVLYRTPEEEIIA